MSNTRLVVGSFWAFFLIGLPFWWKTTEVYRANLPFSEIESWRNGQVYNNDNNEELIKQYRNVPNDMSSMRTVKYSPRYQVTFSLMNNDPSKLTVNWDIQEAVKSYVYPLLRELSMVSNFTVDSQVQNYASLSMKPHYKEREGKPGYYYLNPENLPHFINSADWNLASTISSYSTINFILYVPSPDERLWIHDKQGRPLPGNAFSIPGWGGVVIKNPPPPHTLTEGRHYVMDKKRLQPVLRIFVSQLRTLLGIQDFTSITTNDFNVTFMTAPHTGITSLEKDAVIRKRTVENIVNAASTLNSLAQLVTEIPNMVVLDHIALQVQESLHALDLGCDALQKGEYDTALQHAIYAIELAEEAFFNPTMVSMLYFPDEHKYAIYMPLFVPISVPLIMAIVKALKEMKKKDKSKTE
ncbi:phosphatidylinositol-glycan biosynthesis class S protein [Circinella umbellata]|nr:phosphatidylinositol-glycan biosynthesis class S protein [Circinella umbellata]